MHIYISPLSCFENIIYKKLKVNDVKQLTTETVKINISLIGTL